MNAVPAAQLLSNLRGFGLRFMLTEEGVIKVSPKDRLTPELRMQVEARRGDLLAILETERKAAEQLERRVGEMGARWSYSPEDLEEAQAEARRDPVGWSASCDADEHSARLARQARIHYPP
jgi:hypothetical protein